MDRSQLRKERARIYRDRFRDFYTAMKEQQSTSMRKRHAHFTEIVKDYTSFDDFLHDWREKMELWGVEVNEGEDIISLYIQLDFTDYEEYYVIMGNDGHLAISSVAECKELCASTLVNIFDGSYPDEEDIIKG